MKTGQLIGWRVCIGKPRRHSSGQAYMVRPLFPNGTERKLIFVGGVIPAAGLHVGTSKEFCLDYYAGITELLEGEHELLLELDCTHLVDDPKHEERWEFPSGTEALVTMPKVISITVIK